MDIELNKLLRPAVISAGSLFTTRMFIPETPVNPNVVTQTYINMLGSLYIWEIIKEEKEKSVVSITPIVLPGLISAIGLYSATGFDKKTALTYGLVTSSLSLLQAAYKYNFIG